MNCVFGPVPSRRLGRSLGIDPVPLKTCNWNCVYCQLGRSVPMRPDRAEYVPREAILADVEAALAAAPPDSIDWITFVGSGEPTLHAGLGWMLRRVRSLTALPIAVITNGSLLANPAVREELMLADAVLPSLDAGTPSTYRRIDRPWPGLTFAAHTSGLVDFRGQFPGTLWVEVMLVDGLNSTEPELQALRQMLQTIRPDRVSVLSPIRPQAEPWVRCASPASVAHAEAVLGAAAPAPPSVPPAWDLMPDDELRRAILSLVTRHPMSADEVNALAGANDAQRVSAALWRLEADGVIRRIVRHGRMAWSNAAARYGAAHAATPATPTNDVDASLGVHPHPGGNRHEPGDGDDPPA